MGIMCSLWARRTTAAHEVATTSAAMFRAGISEWSRANTPLQTANAHNIRLTENLTGASREGGVKLRFLFYHSPTRGEGIPQR